MNSEEYAAIQQLHALYLELRKVAEANKLSREQASDYACHRYFKEKKDACRRPVFCLFCTSIQL